MSTPEQAMAHWQQQQERERAALAQQLHGQLGGLLAAMVLHLHQASVNGTADLAALQALLTQAQDCQRQVSARLTPPLLTHLGLSAALTALFEPACTQQGLRLHLALPALPAKALRPAQAIALYRFAEAALANVLQHAQAQYVAVALDVSPQQCQLVITDDGCGCEPEQAWAAARSLCALRASLQGLGGQLALASATGAGTRISATVDV